MSTAPSNNHCGPKKGIDFVFWIPLGVVSLSYLGYFLIPDSVQVHHPGILFAASVYELMNTMAIGLLFGVLFVSLMGRVPREFVLKIVGRPGSSVGVLRATAAGVLLDLCSHGILLIGMKLYERGASLGQTMAFLIASPWNSFSLTIILFTLIGLKWTLAFIVLSMVIAVVSGLVFDLLEKRSILPKNPNSIDLPESFEFWKEAKERLSKVDWSVGWFKDTFSSGLRESKMILKWIFIGVFLAALIRAFVSTENLEAYFGPSVVGLLLTLVGATIIEVCSEGSAPIGAELVTRARAPGNGFAFLMTGVSTDVTELLAIRERTRSTKIAFFLPLVTVPQIVLVALLLNSLGTN